MNPKSGKAGSAVTPAKAKAAEPADLADPGAVAQTKAEQAKSKSGKYGTTPLKPHKESAGEDPERTAWIEIELKDDAGQPVAGEAYQITLPDDTVASGTLDDKGFARVEGIPEGTCKITFTNLDESAWEEA
jgi:type VI secretion system secreted protein VgrG